MLSNSLHLWLGCIVTILCYFML